MRKENSNYITKFNSPFARYLHRIMMSGFDMGEVQFGDLTIVRIGRKHVIQFDEQGFVDHVKVDQQVLDNMFG